MGKLRDDLEDIAEVLEREVNRAFVATDISPAAIPRMVWVDRWDNNHFVRFVLPDEAEIEVIETMDNLRRKLVRKFKRKFLGVCYVDDGEWNWERAATRTTVLREKHGGEL